MYDFSVPDVREQNLPPPNMSLCLEDYLGLIFFKKQKAQEELLPPPLYCLKEFR